MFRTAPRGLAAMVLFAGVLAPGWLLPVGAARAQASGGTMTTRVSVIGRCTVQTNDLQFAIPITPSAPIDAATTVGVLCSRTTPFELTMDNGKNALGAQMRMKGNGGDFLAYNIYRDAARTKAWGTYKGSSAANKMESLPIYGRIPSLPASFASGEYIDTVVLTLTF